MREIESEHINPNHNIKDFAIELMDLLRRDYAFESINYPIILFFICLKKAGFIEKINTDTSLDFKQQLRSAISSSKNESTNAYKVLLKFYDPLISAISNQTFAQIISRLYRLDSTLLDDNFADIFEDLHYEFSKKAGKRIADGEKMPQELSQFLANLVDLQDGASVYNPFASMATFGVFIKNNVNYIGQELNEVTIAWGILRLEAHNKMSNSNLVLGDSIGGWNPTYLTKDNNNSIEYITEEVFPKDSIGNIFNKYFKRQLYDLIISSPPFNLRVKEEYSVGKFGTIRTADRFIIEKGIDSLKENGKLVVCIPSGFLFSNGLYDKRLKRFLVQKDLIETIISFPSGLMLNTGIQVVAIVFSKKKQNPGKIKLVNATDFIEGSNPRDVTLNTYKLNGVVKSNIEENTFVRTIDNKEVVDSDYDLNVHRYVNRFFIKPIEGVKLRELISIFRGTRHNISKPGKLIRIRDLKENLLDFKLDSSSLEVTKASRPDIRQLNQTCLLLAARWKDLRATLFEYKGETVLCGAEIHSFTINEDKVDISYLLNELHKDYVQEQVETFITGTAIPFLKREDLLNIIIKLPPINEQRKIVVEEKLDLIRVEENKIKYLRQQNDLVVEDDNSVLRHRIAGRINNLAGAIEGINEIITSQIIDKLPNLYDLKKSSKSALTFGKYIDILKRDISSIKSIIARDYDVKRENSFKDIDFIKFIREYVLELGNSIKSKQINYKINSENEVFDEEFLSVANIKEIIVAGDESDLKMMLDNLEENAVKHGFKDQPIEKRGINIKCIIDEKNMNLIVNFSNTGNPLPKDFTKDDFIRNGITSDQNNGDGFGGNLINKIIINHNGGLLILNLNEVNPDNEFVTNFMINIPIKEIILNN
jgi:type I restriction enzyme M protein